MLDTNCHFAVLEKVKYPLVNQFYKLHYKKGIASKDEAVFILKSATEIICSAKLKSIENDQLLTGVACAPVYQHQGYGSLLIKKLLALQTQPIYCFPYPHLAHFYQRLGFTLLTKEEAPQHIQKRYSYYQHQHLLLMVRK